MTNFAKLYSATQQILVLGEVLNDEAGQLFCELLRLLAEADPDKLALSRVYARLFRLLAGEAAFYGEAAVGDAWQNHLLDRLLDTENLVAIKSRENRTTRQMYVSNETKTKVPPVDQVEVFLGLGLAEAFRHDLARLQTLYRLNVTSLTGRVREILESQDIAGWSGFRGTSKDSDSQPERYNLKNELAHAADWAAILPRLFSFYRHYDTSDFARYRAFRWVRQPGPVKGGSFEPVRYVDEQRFENLVGYEREREIVISNTEQFLAGLSANNVLLYGARGTGKSSTVKALLPRYAGQGLRLVEVHKSELGDYPLVVEALRDRPEKFIMFVDDLSFEAEEFSYKDLKALLEGSLEARPPNLLIYATSNRRHLIKEQFSDNARPGDEEVNAWDTVEEKLSLADRFGLIVTFVSPNQQQYLAIVDGLARQMNLEIDPEELHRRALRWELSHSGRSGRTARQFIDQLAGELRLKNK
jgi:predicted AAA+ superfamily ATPase